MVYVYSKLSNLNKHIGKALSVDEIKDTLADLGMDIKGESEDKDPELKIEITAEKIDMVSGVGIARAISFYRGLRRELPNYKLKDSKLKLIVKKEADKVRPKTVAAILRNVPMSKELLDEMIEIQEKMHDSFGRHRKKAAIGIYPMDAIEFPITFTAEKPEDIVFRPLESQVEMNANEILEKHDTGKKFGHLLKNKDFYPVFRDNSGKVLSMPPIINSHETGRVENHHKDLFIECSGHNITHLDNILKALVTSFIEFGAQVETLDVEYPNGEIYKLNLANRVETLTLNYVNKLIGINLKEDEKELKKLLMKVQYKLKSLKNGVLEVEIPPHKADIWSDCDIADDIARAYGYNNIVPRTPNVSSVGEELEETKFKDSLTQTMTNLGFLELYTYMLTSTKDQFEMMNLNEEKEEFVKINDSAEEGINMTRTMILPEVLKSLVINRKNKYPQKVFENGFTIQVDKTKDTKARNESRLCSAIADPKANYTHIKEVLDTIMHLNEIKYELKESNLPYLIEGRQAEIMVNKKVIGFIGEIHPQILENVGLIVPVVCFEINVDGLK